MKPTAIDWSKKPDLGFRIRHAWPCWLGGHFWLWLNATWDDRVEWCAKCGLLRLRSAAASRRDRVPFGPYLP